MIILGVILALLGCWILPEFAPEFPPELDHLACVFGIILLVVGAILWLLGGIGGGRYQLGGRRHWY